MSPHEPSNADIYERLGGLTSDMEHAQESRRVIHEKLDNTVRVQGEISSKVDVTKEIAIQARDTASAALQNIHRFESEFHEVHVPAIAAAAATAASVAKFQSNAEPMIRFMQTVQGTIMWMVAGGAVSVVAAVGFALYAREQFSHVLRWMLGL